MARTATLRRPTAGQARRLRQAEHDLELLIKANRRVSTTVEKGLVRAVDAGSDGLEWLLKRAQKRLRQA